jgi:hypothetical protein
MLKTARVAQASLILTILTAILTANAAQAEIALDRIEQGTLYFKGTPSFPALKTDFQELVYLGALRPPEGLPYFLLAGKPCAACPQSQEKGLYLIRPNGGKPTQLVYPGKLIDSKTGSVVMESRAFFGQCLRDRGDVYVAYQKEKVDRKNRLQPSVFIAEAMPRFLHESLLERRMPSFQETLKRVKAKQCREIEGRNRMILNKPLDLNPRRGTDLSEEPPDESADPDEPGEAGEKEAGVEAAAKPLTR